MKNSNTLRICPPAKQFSLVESTYFESSIQCDPWQNFQSWFLLRKIEGHWNCISCAKNLKRMNEILYTFVATLRRNIWALMYINIHKRTYLSSQYFTISHFHFHFREFPRIVFAVGKLLVISNSSESKFWYIVLQLSHTNYDFWQCAVCKVRCHCIFYGPGIRYSDLFGAPGIGYRS